jgi:hypothetical protein
MNPIFKALVPALQVSWGTWWWDSSSGDGDTWGGYQGQNGGQSQTWS